MWEEIVHLGVSCILPGDERGTNSMVAFARSDFYFPLAPGAAGLAFRTPCSARRSSSDSLTFLSSADHQMLQVMQPVRRVPRLSISMSGCLHSWQVPVTTLG